MGDARETDRRWTMLTGLVVAVVVTAWAMRSNWLTVTHASDYRIDWGTVATLAQWSYGLVAVLTFGLVFAMTVGRRRSYLPRLVPIAVAISASICLVAIIMIVRDVGRVGELGLWTDYDFEGATQYVEPHARPSNALWTLVVAVGATIVAASQLGLLAHRRALANRRALTEMNERIAVASGDLLRPENLGELEPDADLPSL